MAYHFRIGDISHFFDIPASTLRYWEDMGVLTPKKDQINNYREYTVENLMSISDVIFYKNLGLPAICAGRRSLMRFPAAARR